MALEPGPRSFVRIVVADTDTAVAMGSGDVPVLGTPRLLALAEAAAGRSRVPRRRRSRRSGSVLRHRPGPAIEVAARNGGTIYVEGRRDAKTPAR
jgi:fluoroacetyl-CoA thioesterase